MHDPKWCLFYDFHTMPACPDVGATFDANAFADRMQACGVDFAVFHARCNLGMAYYDTKVGIRHPSLTHDMFGELAQACQERGIALSAYFNVGLSHEEALLHRDWARVTPEGYVYLPDRMGNFFRSMCYNTPYAEHLLEMVREVVTGYPVAGLFFDCMGPAPCIGVECIREMKEQGLDWSDPLVLGEHARLSGVRMAQRLAETANALNPDLLLYFNGVSYEDQQDLGTYLELECLPTGGWGYEVLPLRGRYMRKLGKPLLNMTGRFHRSWGDFGGIRTEASLEYDVVHGLALGMRATIGDHFHPRGDLNHAVFDLIERIYKRQQRLEPWLEQAKSEAEIGLIVPGTRFADHQTFPCISGASRMLCELKQQFDVLTSALPWAGYRTLVLPDQATLDETATEKVRAHLAAGGTIISSGWSGLDPERGQFVLEEWGASYTGDDPWDPAYLVAGAAVAEGMPDMPVTLYDPGIMLEAGEGTEVLAEVMAPYFSQHWDGEHGFFYVPPAELTGRPAATLRGPVALVSHPIFTSYHKYAPVPMRQLVGNLLGKLLPQPMVLAPTLPSFGRATVTRQPGRRMVWLLSYVPERRGPTMEMIEEPIELREVPLALRTDGRTPRRVYLAPEGQELAWEVRDGYIHTTVPAVPGYAVIVFEE